MTTLLTNTQIQKLEKELRAMEERLTETEKETEIVKMMFLRR